MLYDGMQMIQERDGTNTDSFIYAGDGQRRKKSTSTEDINYLWDGQNVLEELDDSDSLIAHYTGFPGYWGGLSSLALPGSSPAPATAGMGAFNAVQFNQALFNQSSSGVATESHFYLFDLQLSNSLLLDATAATDNEYLYKAFGEKVLSTGTVRNPFQFQGQAGPYFDADTRTQMGARIVDPTAGKWLSPDPIGFVGGDWNLYRFVGNNPINFIDPSGLSVSDWANVLLSWADPRNYQFTGSDPIQGLATGLAATANVASFGLYSGGAYQNQPGYGGSQILAGVGTAAGSLAGGWAVAGGTAVASGVATNVGIGYGISKVTGQNYGLQQGLQDVYGGALMTGLVGLGSRALQSMFAVDNVFLYGVDKYDPTKALTWASRYGNLNEIPFGTWSIGGKTTLEGSLLRPWTWFQHTVNDINKITPLSGEGFTPAFTMHLGAWVKGFAGQLTRYASGEGPTLWRQIFEPGLSIGELRFGLSAIQYYWDKLYNMLRNVCP